MTGSGFLRDLPAQQVFGSGFPRAADDGILYVEDFDAPPGDDPEAAVPAAAAAPPPLFSAADVEAAHAAGRAEGMQAALQDARLTQAQLQAAATQSLTDALLAGRQSLEKLASRQAEATAQSVLAILAAALPRAMQDHASGELRSVIDALLPGLRAEADLRIRTHPEQADAIRSLLLHCLAGAETVFAVSADPALAPGDIAIAWADGSARRSTGDIYMQIRAALAPLNLPSFEDITRGPRS